MYNILEDKIKTTGLVTDVLPGDKFKVLLQNNQEIICYIAGKIRKNHIKILEGDTVDIELSVYDLSNGRIVYRR